MKKALKSSPSSPDLRESQRFPPALLDELAEAGQLRVGEERITLEKLERVAAGFGDDRRVAEKMERGDRLLESVGEGVCLRLPGRRCQDRCRPGQFWPRSIAVRRGQSSSRCTRGQSIERHAKGRGEPGSDRQRRFAFILFELREIALGDAGLGCQLNLRLLPGFSCAAELLPQCQNAFPPRRRFSPCCYPAADLRFDLRLLEIDLLSDSVVLRGLSHRHWPFAGDAFHPRWKPFVPSRRVVVKETLPGVDANRSIDFVRRHRVDRVVADILIDDRDQPTRGRFPEGNQQP
jgi:hypothetical protein